MFSTNAAVKTTDKSNFLRAEAELILDEARKAKAEKIKHLGEPIQLTGVALDLHVRGNFAWIAENTAVVRKVDLQTGKTVRMFMGHSAPVTAIAFYDKVKGSGDGKILISSSWDRSVKLWDAESRKILSSTSAHSDFVKSLLVIPSLDLLVSSSSDKIVRFWDLATFEEGKPLNSAGSISAHSRPVEAIAFRPASSTSAILYTADTMGIIKVWEISKDSSELPLRYKTKLLEELSYHRTKIASICYGIGQLWTASMDETAQVYDDPPVPRKPGEKPMPPITHPTAVRAILPLGVTELAEPYVLTGSGDVIRAFDVSSPDEPELLGETDGHWHDVTALKLWMRKTAVEGDNGKFKVEPWVVSASLDGTIRKWRLADLLHPPKQPLIEEKPELVPVPVENEAKETEKDPFGMTDDEERELADLMADD